MSYIDGFVAAVPKAARQKYIEHATLTATLFREYGALKIVECWADDVPTGEITSFPSAVHCKEDESVVFAWVEWSSREARDAGWKKCMDDPRMSPENNPMPFDGKRLIYGGFEPIVEM